MSDNYTIAPTEVDGFGFYEVTCQPAMYDDVDVSALCRTMRDAFLVARALSAQRDFLVGLEDHQISTERDPQGERSARRIKFVESEFGQPMGLTPYPLREAPHE